eukprot:s469_g29.t1
MAGELPSTLVWADKSKSKREAANVCMAAWASMALHRAIKAVATDRWRMAVACLASNIEFKPIVNIRLFYKTFAHMMLHRIDTMMLHRIDTTLDMEHPEEQNGSRAGRRMEEHVLTTNLIVDTNRRLILPMWIVSLEVSKAKAFDRVLGQHYGEHVTDKESQIIWFGFWELYICRSAGPSDGTMESY